MIKFIIAKNYQIPTVGENVAYLELQNWDDFGFKTLFSLTLFDKNGKRFNIGDVKIAYKDQDGGYTSSRMDQEFERLSDSFYSLGQDLQYYKNILSLPQSIQENLFSSLKDVIHDQEALTKIENEDAFNASLLRDGSMSTTVQQYIRLMSGEAPQSNYHFGFYPKDTKSNPYLKLDFEVKPETLPPSNIHVLIGRNGSGKTTIINDMIAALIDKASDFAFCEKTLFGMSSLRDDYFSGVVSVSFSAFDSYDYPEDQNDPRKGMRYHYIGLKKRLDSAGGLKNLDDLSIEFSESLESCLSLSAKKQRWQSAISMLGTDTNFEASNFFSLSEVFNNSPQQFKMASQRAFKKLSSGHAIVLLTITKLVETVEEKTLVLLDEPETHLHPPLLSALIRALSNLLKNRNGVAIAATHSPVVLQEVPATSVSILSKTGSILKAERPAAETFGENVGSLTREVFKLEVMKSGFYVMLKEMVNEGYSFEMILRIFKDQIGFEGRAILNALIANQGK